MCIKLKRTMAVLCAVLLITGTAALAASATGTADSPLTDTVESEQPPVETPLPPTEEPTPTEEPPPPESSYPPDGESSFPPDTSSEYSEPSYPDPEYSEVPQIVITPTPYVAEYIAPTPTVTPNANTSKVIRPKATLNGADDTTSTSTTPKASNYVVFAQMNTKNNALAVNMFYGGIVSIVLGFAGVVILIVLFVRGRRYVRDEREGIFEEIEQAENRNRAAAPAQAAALYDEASNVQDEPAQYRAQDTFYETAESNISSNSGRQPMVPQEASMYTEELDLADVREEAGQMPEESYGAGYEDEYEYQQPEAPIEPSPPVKEYDTEEILREALRRDDDTE